MWRQVISTSRINILERENKQISARSLLAAAPAPWTPTQPSDMGHCCKGQQNLKKRWCKTNWSLNGWSWKQCASPLIMWMTNCLKFLMLCCLRMQWIPTGASERVVGFSCYSCLLFFSCYSMRGSLFPLLPLRVNLKLRSRRVSRVRNTHTQRTGACVAPDGEQQHFDVLREKQCPMLNFGRFRRPERWARLEGL